MKAWDNFIEKNLKEQEAKTNKYMEERDAAAVFPENVEEIKDLRYGDGPRSRMDVYRPRETKGTLPVIVDFHGGGLMLCDKEFNRYYCAELAARGFLVFNVEYPLAPATKVYDILHDAFLAVQKVCEIAGEYQGNEGKLALVGDSAGAWLALYVSAAWRSRKLAKVLNVTSGSWQICALGMISGEYYVRTLTAKNILMRGSYYGDHPKKHPFAPYTNPECDEIIQNLPPVYLQTGSGDHLRKETLQYADALKKKGTCVTLSDYEGDEKELRHVFPVVAPTTDAGKKAIDEMCEFLLKYL